MNVLVVDDEKMLADMLTDILKRNKIDADAVYDGLSAVDFALSGKYDAAVLDIMLPDIDGFEVIRRLRSQQCKIPVLLLSAKSEVSDKIEGLDTGADDYLTKPFVTGEFLARVKALLRRSDSLSGIGGIVKAGDIELDKNKYTLKRGAKEIRLSATEFKIAEILIAGNGAIIPKEMIIEKVWGWEQSEYNNVEVYVSFLRKKLEAIGSCAAIKSYRNIGYSFETENK